MAIAIGDYCRVGGYLCEVIGNPKPSDERVVDGWARRQYLIRRSKGGAISEFYFDSKYLAPVNHSADAKAVIDEARYVNNSHASPTELGQESKHLEELRVDSPVINTSEVPKPLLEHETKQGSVAEQNKLIWERFYPDQFTYLSPSGRTSRKAPFDDDEEEEDWRPFFLRENPKQVDQEILCKKTVVPIADEVVVSVNRQIKCHDERSDEAMDDPWFIADDEPRDPLKVTDALLMAWHRIKLATA